MGEAVSEGGRERVEIFEYFKELRLSLYMHYVHVPLPSPVRPPRGWWPVLGR